MSFGGEEEGGGDAHHEIFANEQRSDGAKERWKEAGIAEGRTDLQSNTLSRRSSGASPATMYHRMRITLSSDMAVELPIMADMRVEEFTISWRMLVCSFRATARAPSVAN